MGTVVINLQQIKKKIKEFVKERDWERFHSPKNLSMSLAIEVAELMEHFQWTNTVEEAVNLLKGKRKRSEVEDEVADIAIYLLSFCNLYNIDLERAILRKMDKNAKKYPVSLTKGKNLSLNDATAEIYNKLQPAITVLEMVRDKKEVPERLVALSLRNLGKITK